jgi:ABC-type uncharacterized transport system YnjBCD permease subunit
MLGGIVLQLGSVSYYHILLDKHHWPGIAGILLLYAALAAEFLIRFNFDRPRRHIRESGISHPRGTVNKPTKFMLSAMGIMVVLLIIRSIYRTVELSDGWTGKVISTQWLFGTSSHLHTHCIGR